MNHSSNTITYATTDLTDKRELFTKYIRAYKGILAVLNVGVRGPGVLKNYDGEDVLLETIPFCMFRLFGFHYLYLFVVSLPKEMS